MTSTEFLHRLAAAATASEVNLLIHTGIDLREGTFVANVLLDAAVRRLDTLPDALPPSGRGGGAVEALTENFPKKD